MTCLSPAARGRAKRAAARAVSLAGGIEAAALGVGRAKSTVGRWHALNDSDLPPVDAALALDEIALACAQRPAFADWLCAELGGVFLPLPQGDAGAAALLGDAGRIAEGAGACVVAIAAAVTDGRVDAAERRELIARGDALVQQVAAMTARLRAEAEGEVKG